MKQLFVRPDPQTVEKVRSLVDERGVAHAAKRLDLNRQTVVRLLAGLSVRNETLRSVTAILPAEDAAEMGEGQPRGE
ncbi:MAG: hypothetical protein WDO74_10950 [Pseudomonadota bacterium]